MLSLHTFSSKLFCCSPDHHTLHTFMSLFLLCFLPAVFSLAKVRCLSFTHVVNNNLSFKTLSPRDKCPFSLLSLPMSSWLDRLFVWSVRGCRQAAGFDRLGFYSQVGHYLDLSNLFIFFWPQFPHLQSRDNNNDSCF